MKTLKERMLEYYGSADAIQKDFEISKGTYHTYMKKPSNWMKFYKKLCRDLIVSPDELVGMIEHQEGLI